MKKYLIPLFSLALLGGMFFTSCGNDDDGPDQPIPNQPGTFTVNSQAYSFLGNEKMEIDYDRHDREIEIDFEGSTLEIDLKYYLTDPASEGPELNVTLVPYLNGDIKYRTSPNAQWFVSRVFNHSGSDNISGTLSITQWNPTTRLATVTFDNYTCTNQLQTFTLNGSMVLNIKFD